MQTGQKRLGDILLEKKFITARQLEIGLSQQAGTKAFLGEILVSQGAISAEQLLMVLSEQFNMSVVALSSHYIDWQTTKRFSATLVLDHKCLPFEEQDGVIMMAITNPLDAWLRAQAQDEAYGASVRFFLTTAADMDEALIRYKQYLKGSVSGLL